MRNEMEIMKRITGRSLMYALLIFTVVISIFPVLWVIVSSFKTNGEIMGGPFVLPSVVNFDAYVYLFSKYNFLVYAANSVMVSVIPTLLSLFIYSLAAYVIAKYDFKGKNIFYALFTITLLVPSHSRTQPIFSMIVNMGLYNTKEALILVYLSGGMAMSMFILKASFQSVPKDLTEAATIDGAHFLRIFSSINLPLAFNGIVTAGVLMFLNNWNEFYYANLLVTSTSNRTLPVVTILFNSMFSYNYTNTFAALTVVIIPGILIYAIAQKRMQDSIVGSAIKG
jgi:raffinose/stachyose/melibiose transport system permease protein